MLKQFLFPKLSGSYVLRVLLIGVIAVLVFKYVFVPIRIRGHSMEPTYENGGVNFCFRLRYLFSDPERYDVVAIRMAGEKVLLLKRIVALQGERVAFDKGVLLINEKPLAEPYLKYPSDWTMSPKTVKKGFVYVVGDNRHVPISVHRFGQTPVNRIAGGPLW